MPLFNLIQFYSKRLSLLCSKDALNCTVYSSVNNNVYQSDTQQTKEKDKLCLMTSHNCGENKNYPESDPTLKFIKLTFKFILYNF